MLPTPQIQNDMSQFMENLQRDISMYSSLIEQEKRKFPPNLSLIQHYINLQSQKIEEFKIRIPYLPNQSTTGPKASPMAGHIRSQPQLSNNHESRNHILPQSNNSCSSSNNQIKQSSVPSLPSMPQIPISTIPIPPIQPIPSISSLPSIPPLPSIPINGITLPSLPPLQSIPTIPSIPSIPKLNLDLNPLSTTSSSTAGLTQLQLQTTMDQLTSHYTQLLSTYPLATTAPQITVKIVFMNDDTGEIDAENFKSRNYPYSYSHEDIKIAVK